ncbi:MAG TPA: NnrS family protein, partial [Steroidobacteraceae bacterium]
LLVAIDIVLLLITIIGGRIVPAFTTNALRARGMAADLRSSSWVEAAAIGAMVGVIVADVIAPWGTVAGAVAALAAIAQAWRFAGWRSLRARDEPLVWSLHLAYAWLPVGLAMKAVYLLTGAPWSARWLHALTIGAAAAMVLAVMSRASLGHTGRALVAPRPVALAYLLLCLAALVRVFLPSLAAVNYQWTVMLAGALWIAAFALFVIAYTPILMRPRIDARPG